MKRLLVLATTIFGTIFGTILAAVFLAATPTAHAGGWAVSTLDPFTAPAVGEEAAVGFTIRQHGVTPVDLDDVFITIVAPSGKSENFAATQSGDTGHYTATVVFREEGSSTWRINQGWFAPHELGAIDVTAGPTAIAAPTGSDDQAPAVVRYGLPALAIALGAFAVVDVVRTRRRRTATVA